MTEFLRLRWIYVPITADIINYCAYPYEKKIFILPPLFFSISLLISLIFFGKTSAYVGITALTLGDGICTLIGRMGRLKLPYNRNKTLEGSLTCFGATFLGSLLFQCFALLVSLS